MRKNGIVVSLDGHGADEYAFGYNNYALEMFYDGLKSSNETKANEAVSILGGLSPNYNTQWMILGAPYTHTKWPRQYCPSRQLD